MSKYNIGGQVFTITALVDEIVRSLVFNWLRQTNKNQLCPMYSPLTKLILASFKWLGQGIVSGHYVFLTTILLSQRSTEHTTNAVK